MLDLRSTLRWTGDMAVTFTCSQIDTDKWVVWSGQDPQAEVYCYTTRELAMAAAKLLFPNATEDV